MPKHQNSVFRELALGLLAVALVGTVLVLVTVVYEYGFSFSELVSLRDLDAALPEIFDHVILPVMLLAVPMAVAGLWVMRRAFAPLHAAARQIEAFQSPERGFRIDTAPLPAEAVPFVDAINALLRRLEESATQQEAFAADVAHELRGPLTVLSLELDQLDSATAARLKGDVASMRRLVDQLMLLARIDAAKAATLPQEIVSLHEIGAEVVAKFAPKVIAADKIIELEGNDNSLTVLGQRESVFAAVRNLVENAIRVTPAGGAVRVCIGPETVVRVQDGGPGLTPGRLQELTQRLVRADHSSNEGAGLGLAIVDRIMTAHGGKLSSNFDARELELRFPTFR